MDCSHFRHCRRFSARCFRSCSFPARDCRVHCNTNDTTVEYQAEALARSHQMLLCILGLPRSTKMNLVVSYGGVLGGRRKVRVSRRPHTYTDYLEEVPCPQQMTRDCTTAEPSRVMLGNLSDGKRMPRSWPKWGWYWS